MQLKLFNRGNEPIGAPFKSQLLKWVGNKQRFASEIVSYFPEKFGTYYEPFLGSAGVLATLAPQRAVGSDAFDPLVVIWKTLRDDTDLLKSWYEERWLTFVKGDKVKEYEKI